MKNFEERAYEAPAGLRIYAIGDVHGYPDVLEWMHDKIYDDMRSFPVGNVHIVYLGDYVDRGPDSAGVIETLCRLKNLKDGFSRSFLKGNHESAIFEFMKGPHKTDWLRYGGLKTLESYGIVFQGDIPLPSEVERASVLFRKTIPSHHLDFLKKLQNFIEIGDYFFAHAGVNPLVPFSSQSEQDLTCIRQPFLSWHKHENYEPFTKRVVHGHSISREPIIRPHRIGVDTGLYEGGPLSCAVLEGSDIRFLQVFPNP